MFGLDKFKDLRKNAEETKARLEKIEVDGYAGNKLVKVTCTGNRKISAVEIDERVFRTADKDQMEKLILEATNAALHEADKIMESEMRAIMPNIPGLGL
ncbi:MAG: YbaB/EbfC family nucleoid-associated protein [Bacteroidetes bacterium]|nr:YbaB/EbfC family nucleoid-associated protein [Bacteroidota bacterium]